MCGPFTLDTGVTCRIHKRSDDGSYYKHDKISDNYKSVQVPTHCVFTHWLGQATCCNIQLSSSCLVMLKLTLHRGSTDCSDFQSML